MDYNKDDLIKARQNLYKLKNQEIHYRYKQNKDGSWDKDIKNNKLEGEKEMITIKGINKNNELEYELIGGKLQYSNQLIITDTTNNEMIYDKTITTFETTHKIPNDVLENGKTYKLLLLALDEDDNFIGEAEYYYIPTSLKPVMKLRTEKDNGGIKIITYVKQILERVENGEDITYEDGTWKDVNKSTIGMNINGLEEKLVIKDWTPTIPPKENDIMTYQNIRYIFKNGEYIPIDIITDNDLYFAKVESNAIIPSKREEDAGYDIYTCETETIFIPPCSTRMIDTGIAIACSKNYFPKFFDKGGMGSKGIIVGAGVGDSGYRDKYFIPLVNTNEDKYVVITNQSQEEIDKSNYFDLNDKMFKKSVCIDNYLEEKLKRPLDVIFKEDCIIKPLNKAITQFVMLPVPKMNVKEITYEELKNIKSERGLGKLGSSNK
jgi:dUTP pyrophosphatase